jgi:murein DD-endopeptidase MepM/ murein hydrolase activator NlpD
VVRGVAIVAAGVVALSAPALARAYGWPVKPFDRQHAVRGAFDDPRFGRFFHFGVDIVARDGSAVYAVESGTVFTYSDAVAVRRPGGREFSYWHVRATVPEHSFVKKGERIGVVRAGFGHVHFAEFDGRTYVNPLRRGALTPFRDTTVPFVGPIDVRLSDGAVTATVEAFDLPAMVLPAPWRNAIWTPETVRWRLLESGVPVVPWTIAADFSRFQPAGRYTSVYAPGTRQNRPNRPGRYVFWLTHRLSLLDGSYALQVRASDTRGNTGRGAFEFDLTGDQILRTTKLASR